MQKRLRVEEDATATAVVVEEVKVDTRPLPVDYEVGPALGTDLLDQIAATADTYYSQGISCNSVSYNLVYDYDPRHTPVSMGEFGRWHARMSYLANHRATLELSRAFSNRLVEDFYGIIYRFMKDHAEKHPVIKIERHIRDNGGIEFFWHFRDGREFPRNRN